MKTYKGFNQDMTCRGFQYEIGKEYEEEQASCCNSGFHACEAPLDVFNYYPPATSRYCEVEQSGDIDRHGDDSKVASTKIKIGAEIDVAGLVKAHIEYVKEHVTHEVKDDGAATAGYCGAATSRGSVTVGKYGCGLVRGSEGEIKIRGGMGAVLVICAEYDDSYDIKDTKMITIDGETYQPDTWYTIRNGEVVKA